MTTEIIRCRHCEQALTRVGKFWVCPQHGQVSLEKQSDTLRIFFSYAHDANEELVRRIKIDLEKRGHDVWFDKSDLKFGDDWRRSITEGIINSHKFVAFLSKHSVRDPGVCRDEIGIAIGVNEGNIQTILVESEQEVQPTPGISATQWLDMHDWRERRAAGDAVWENWYREKLAEIVRVVESDESRRFAGEIETLKHHLKPTRSDSRIYELLRKGLTGRQWLFDEVERWRSSDRASRVFWLMGAPGVGKSAIAAHLAIHGREVLAVEFCNWQQPSHKNPELIIRTIAFQIATRLADYRKVLLALPQIAELNRKNYAELFDYILADPLHHVIDGGRERHLIVIDALDEANEAGSNPLVEMLAHYAHRLPNWIGLVLTSRPESDVIAPLQALNPVRFEASSEKNLVDIHDYVRHELASELNSRPNADRLLKQILENSEGLFLYVERFCEDIRLGHFSLDSPEQFPQGLGGIFFQYFRRQFPNLKQYEKTIEPALGAILASRERLPVRTLQKLFRLREPQVRKWLRTFGSLFPVTKDGDNDVITPYHRSLADWMADASRAGVYFVSVGEGHQLFVEQLLRERGKESQLCLRNLPYHLVGAGRREDAQALLSDETWIEKKFFALGFEAILSDVDLIVQSAVEQEDWPTGLGAAVAGATALEQTFQIPPKEIIPIYARAGAGRHAVEMAQYVEGEYERAYLLTEIANAAEESDPELARTIRWQLWSSCKCRSSTDQVIVSRLAYADPQQLASFLQQCETDLHRAIVSYLLKDENTLHQLVDLPVSDVASICAHLASASNLTKNEELFIAGFDPDLHRAESRLELPIALSLLEIRKLVAQQPPNQAEAIARAMISVALGNASYIQLFIRALLAISAADTLLGAKERPDPEERIRLFVEISIAQAHRKDYDGALTAILEAVRLDEQNKHRYFRTGVYPGGARWVVVEIIRGIAKTDPNRALELAKQSGLQRLTDIYLDEVVLWQLSNYKEVKKVARNLNLHERSYAYELRAKHDLAGAYAAWKEKDGDVDELKAMLKHARAGEGALILKLLREEVLPKVYPAQEPADTTALKVEIARAVSPVNREMAEGVRNTIHFDRYRQSRINQVCLLPAFALAGDPEGALSWAWHLDKDDVGFGAVAMSEMARLSASGVIKFEDDLSLRSWFCSALRDIRKSNLTSEDVNVIFSWPWAWANARVAGSIARRLTPRRMNGHFDWRPEQTLAVMVGKASGFWPAIREELNQDWIESQNRELALCEASQWMPIDEWPMLEDIKSPALAAIAWGRMARRTSSAREREEWNRRVHEACESWPDPKDGQGLDVLWVFTDEMGPRNKLSRSLAARILDRCRKESFDFAPSLLAVAGTGVFNKEQRERVTNLAFKWRDFLHTHQFANNVAYNDAQWLAAKHLLQLADVWWKTDATNARACLDLAVDHAREMTADPRRSRLQTQCLRSWANCGEAEDWKRALAHWRWGAPFLNAADAFVARWSAGGDPAYPEIQKTAIAWGQEVAEELLKLR